MVQGFSRIDHSLTSEEAVFSPVNSFDREVNGVASNKSFGTHFFSVRWTGLVRAMFSEVYTFQCSSHGSVRLYIDGVLVLNKARTSQLQAAQGTIALLRSVFVDIRIDYSHIIGRYGTGVFLLQCDQKAAHFSSLFSLVFRQQRSMQVYFWCCFGFWGHCNIDGFNRHPFAFTI